MFFKDLSNIAVGLELTMRIKQKDGKMTVSVFPEGIEGVQPLIVAGSPEEMDAEFLNTIRTPMYNTGALLHNVKEYGAALQKSTPAPAPEDTSPALPQKERGLVPGGETTETAPLKSGTAPKKSHHKNASNDKKDKAAGKDAGATPAPGAADAADEDLYPAVSEGAGDVTAEADKPGLSKEVVAAFKAGYAESITRGDGGEAGTLVNEGPKQKSMFD